MGIRRIYIYIEERQRWLLFIVFFSVHSNILVCLHVQMLVECRWDACCKRGTWPYTWIMIISSGGWTLPATFVNRRMNEGLSLIQLLFMKHSVVSVSWTKSFFFPPSPFGRLPLKLNRHRVVGTKHISPIALYIQRYVPLLYFCEKICFRALSEVSKAVRFSIF